jgi:hypothetical protein
LKNIHSSTINIIDQLKFFFYLGTSTFSHLNALLKELNETMGMHFEHHAHAIAQELVQLLRELPKEGNQDKINTAEQIIKAYEAPITTRPSSPLSEENSDDKLFPIPIRFPSAWCKTKQ